MKLIGRYDSPSGGAAVGRLGREFRVQISAALDVQEAGWSAPEKVTQAEVTTATMLAYVRRGEPAIVSGGRYPRLERMAVDCERLLALIA